MKLLVIGIDGGDKKIIDVMPMPFLKGLMNKSKSYPAKLDLMSRGWSEIYTGLHGSETGGFYRKPSCDGTLSYTEKYNQKTLFDTNSSAEPIWQALNNLGYRVGIMNLPTTMPAPKVNGFFVSGAGGGSDKSGTTELPIEACHPPSIKDELDNIGYILDIRVQSSGIEDLDTLFNKYIEMEEKRTTSFIHLSQKYDIDFGFIAYMGIKSISYLLRADIQPMLDFRHIATEGIERSIQDFFAKIDLLFSKLIESLSPENILIVSDHGMAPYLHNVNLNQFLQAAGYQTINKSTSGAIRRVGKGIKSLLPRKLRKNMGTRLPGVREYVGKPDFDTDSSIAFGATYISGIYINDARFGGKHDSDDLNLLEGITKKFNAYLPAKQAGLKAHIYRPHFKGSKAQDFLPDIWIDHPDTIFFKGFGPFISENSQYKKFTSFSDMLSDMNSGIKGETPLIYLYNTDGSKIINVSQNNDLTTAYNIILTCMS